ncbi:hypothetical protein H8K32_13435 [Undibacterium jejuense]|uniref:DUF4760 domain-containing protein n=1 Tax=Undibacterium jejuense TaxID=1344949 RepID=A0A923HEK2_9BURK|nr:hypothetical protein [Undibacterium jejuense]MBC3863107.1 hypothetical protein [Undibacterium jejuense]
MFTDLNSLSTWGSIGAAFFAFCTVIVSVCQIKANNRVANASIESQKEMTRLNLTMQFIDKYDSPHIREKRRELAKHLMQEREYGRVNKTGIYIAGVEYVIDILESVGILYQRGWLDNSLVYNSFSYPVMQWWYALEGYIIEGRDAGIAEYYDKFQFLAQTFINREEAQRMMTVESKDKELSEFLQSEIS